MQASDLENTDFMKRVKKNAKIKDILTFCDYV